MRLPRRLLLLTTAPFEYAGLVLFLLAALSFKCRDWFRGHDRHIPED